MANSIKIGNDDMTFKVGSVDVDAIYLGNTLVYSAGTPSHDYSQDYLTFVATTDSCSFSFSGNNINYSLDDGATWTTLQSGAQTPTLNQGDKILWKGTLRPYSDGIGRFSATGPFSVTGNFTVEGNIMSLLYGDNFVGQTSLSGKNNAFKNLFYGMPWKLQSAENLILPATTLSENCYYGMFNGCNVLTTAPELLATTLTNQCYYTMFYGCFNLTTAPSILPATTLANSCYGYMFYQCIKLTTAPTLPATTLVEHCYNSMFNGCISLNSIICLATDISATSCTYNWVNDVSSSGTFIKAASMNDWTSGSNGIPSTWTVVNYSG